jgi:hypothetical protein
MYEEDIDVLKMLFVEHHRQLAEKRQKIHSVAEKTLAVFILLAGWLVFAKDPMTPGVRWVIIVMVMIVAVGTCRNVVVNNRSYYDIAAVIRRLNYALGLFESGKFIPDQALYDDAWKDFGQRGKVKAALFHILAISAGAVLCIFAAFMRR